MGIVAQVNDGQVVSSTSTTSSSSSKKSTLDRDDFLQLLVAQMKYQDPLEPTSNTEYVAQLATFSQLEELQNMGTSNDIKRASELVSKPVIVKVTDPTTGNVYYAAGYVDAMKVENGKPYLYINKNYYSLDDVDTVLDEDYYKDYLDSISNGSESSGSGTSGSGSSGSGSSGSGTSGSESSGSGSSSTTT